MKCSRCEKTAVSFSRWCRGVARVRCRHCRADLCGDQWLRLLVPFVLVAIFAPGLLAAYLLTRNVTASLLISGDLALLMATIVAVFAWLMTRSEHRRLSFTSDRHATAESRSP